MYLRIVQTGDNFGTSVDLTADTFISGAPFDDDNASESGSAYIYHILPGIVLQNPGIGSDDVEVWESGSDWLIYIDLETPATHDVTIDVSFDNGPPYGAEENNAPNYHPLVIRVGMRGRAVLRISAIDDAIYEGLHTDHITFTASSTDPLYNGSGATFIGGVGADNNEVAVNIVDNEAIPDIIIDDPIVTEGNSGSFTVSIDPVVADDTEVNFTVTNGTATGSGTDYTVISSSPVTIPAETSSVTLDFTTNDDGIFEGNEDFVIDLTNATNPLENPTIGDSQGIGTINDNETPPELSLSPVNVTHNEGDAGTTAYEFTVTLSNPSSEVVTVDYSTTDDTATTADSDYVDNDNTLTFNPGDPLTQTMTVLVNGDTQFETDEDFTVSLDASTNSTIDGANDSATGTITNDDSQPVVSIGRPYVLWAGGSCTNDISILGGGIPAFIITGDIHSNSRIAANNRVTVYGHGSMAEFSPSDNAIWIPNINNPRLVDPQPDDPLQYDVEDYAPGGSKWQEAVDDPNAVAVSYPCASPGDTMTSDWLTSEGYLSDDMLEDGLYYAACNIDINDSMTSNATSFVSTGQIDIHLTPPSSTTLDLHPYTDGIALFSDFGTQSCVSFTAAIQISGSDNSLEGILYAPNSGVDINGTDFTLDGSIIADSIDISGSESTITYQEFPGTPIASTVPHDEGDSGTTPYEFEVTLSNPSAEVVTVNFSTTDGTATIADNDYVDNDNILIFNPGDPLTQTITVLVNGDIQFEDDEDFTVSLDSSTNSTIDASNDIAAGSITNDDDPLANDYLVNATIINSLPFNAVAEPISGQRSAAVTPLYSAQVIPI